MDTSVDPKIQITYYSDPLCAYCWVFEPILKKFRLQYGKYFDFTTRMGGLIGYWEGFPSVFNDPYNPADIKDHWAQVAASYHMPVDGGLWLSNPIKSSYPSSFLYLYIRKYYPELAETFLRELREAVFVKNKPIDKEDALIEILTQIGLDNSAKILSESKYPEILDLMRQDLESGKRSKIEGFPTLIFHNPKNGENNEKDILLFGTRSYSYYVDGLTKALGDMVPMPVPDAIPPLSVLIAGQSTYYAKEISILYDIPIDKVIKYCKKHLPKKTFQTKSVLGETAVFLVKNP